MFKIFRTVIVFATLLAISQVLNNYEYNHNIEEKASIQEQEETLMDKYQEVLENHGFSLLKKGQDTFDNKYYLNYINSDNDTVDIEFRGDKYLELQLTYIYNQEDFENDLNNGFNLVKDLINMDISLEIDSINNIRNKFEETFQKQTYYTYIDADYVLFSIEENNNREVIFSIFIQNL